MKKSKQAQKDLSDYPEIMTPDQVKEYLQISRATFYRWLEDGKMPGAVKIGGSWRIHREKLRVWLDQNA